MDLRPLALPLLIALGCGSAPQEAPPEAPPAQKAAATRFVVMGPDAPSPGMAIATAQVVALLEEATGEEVAVLAGGSAIPAGAVALSLGANPTTRRIIAAGEASALGAEAYLLRRGAVGGATVLAAEGGDALGDQYGAYALLEALGFGFFHPFDRYVPDEVSVPATLNLEAVPQYHWRGMHLHTMHPIEMMDSLLIPSEEGLEEARRYIDWLVMNRQDYFQWVLQDTVDLDTWLPHAAAIVSYAHERGIRVGIDTPFQFIQQNGWVLVPHRGPWQPQLYKRLETIMAAGWDVINVELGTSEFIPADDVQTVEMLDAAAEFLDEYYDAELITKVHCSTGQTAPSYDDINFNFLPGLADPRVGVLPHTVQFYDLYRTAPTYDNEDFSDMREFLLGEIGERTVLYYPETAYWVSFDVDVPLFLPHYVYSRFNDLNRLAGSGMDGQVNFSSGWEWGYWLGDWAAAAFAFDPLTPWQDTLAHFTKIFGPARGEMHALLTEIIEEQGTELLETSLIAYLIGIDTADDFGYLVGIHAQPERPLFREVRAMGSAELEAYAAEILPDLAALESRYRTFSNRMNAVEADIPPAALSYYWEMRRSLKVTYLRVQHARRLVEGTIHRTRGTLGTDPAGEVLAQERFTEAGDLRRSAEGVIAAMEETYRFPVERIARRRENPTSYEFGYLYTVSDAYHWRREELQAIDNNICPCLGNLADQLSNAFGEGHPLAEWVEGWPELPAACLDQCAHPVERIEDLGGSQ